LSSLLRVNPWQELRRRKVFRTAGLYIVGAWLVIQVADIFFPAWGLPETAIRYLFVAAAACFPVALVFGWFFDVTADGIVRTEAAGDDEAVDLGLKRFDYVILVALLAIGAAVVLGSLGKIRDEIDLSPAISGPLEKLANSVAVLPFANRDGNTDTAYFSLGVTEEILHRMSTLGGLHVLASTSSFAFRESDEPPAGIGDKLGVRYLLLGSVGSEGDRVRVTARLHDENGVVVWSDRFDRKLEKIFLIQTEIASQVASHIRDAIVPPQQLPEGRTTENMEAYHAFLEGKAYFDTRAGAWKERAGAAFDRAIELDPGFAPPYAGKATLAVNSGAGPQWEESRELAERSLELDPELPLGYAILGLTQTALGDDERSVESLQRAIDLDPSLAIAYQWIDLPLRRLGRHDEAAAMMERGLEKDPFNPILLRNKAGDESYSGNFDRAEQLLLRLTRVPEPPVWTFSQLSRLYAAWGRYTEAIDAAKDDARHSIRDGNDGIAEDLAERYAALGLVDDATHWYGIFRSRYENSDPPVHASYSLATLGAGKTELSRDLANVESLVASEEPYDAPYLLSYGGLGWIQLGQPEKGIEWLDRGIGLYQLNMAGGDASEGIDYELLDRNWGPELVAHLAQRMAFAGRAAGDAGVVDDAMSFLQQIRTSATLPANPHVLERRALSSELSGDRKAALGYLRQALKLGWANYYGAVNDPAWDGALEAPEFQAVLVEARANNDKQRAIVEAADAEHDFRAELEQLLSTHAEQR
jgi:TolB-like protein